MEEVLLELQYLAIMELVGENSAEFPSREQVSDKINEMTAKGQHLSVVMENA